VIVKTVVSVTTPDVWQSAVESGADLIEVRLDLLEEDRQAEMLLLCRERSVPVIVTLRSAEEGGNFTGTPAEWFSAMEPWLGCADYIDVEGRYATYAPRIREKGAAVIGSWHTDAMPAQPELAEMLAALCSYADIPKIIVTPKSAGDVLALLEFTLHARKPLCTGVLGEQFRYARVVVLLFGSEFAYCHAGTPTAPGQYHVGELRRLLEMLK
jgi:3-dehydroquinate dehydratase-1